MNDETIQSSTDANSTPVAPISDEHAAALDLAATAQTPEDKAAADTVVQEAVDNARQEVPEVETPVSPREDQASGAPDVAQACSPVPKLHPETETEDAHHILTTIEDEIESLLHSPLALVAWVKSKVAEAKAKL